MNGGHTYLGMVFKAQSHQEVFFSVIYLGLRHLLTKIHIKYPFTSSSFHEYIHSDRQSSLTVPLKCNPKPAPPYKTVPTPHLLFCAPPCGHTNLCCIYTTIPISALLPHYHTINLCYQCAATKLCHYTTIPLYLYTTIEILSICTAATPASI